MRNPDACLLLRANLLFFLDINCACRRCCRAAIPSALIVFFSAKKVRMSARKALATLGGSSIGLRGIRDAWSHCCWAATLRMFRKACAHSTLHFRHVSA
jgi:hypothetical protein